MVQRSTVHGTAPCRNEQSAAIRTAKAPLELADYMVSESVGL